ncbi:MAG: hypothetical protein ACI8PZ_003460 [Myxococcota bacterium]|jgi:hypothetical protein
MLAPLQPLITGDEGDDGVHDLHRLVLADDGDGIDALPPEAWDRVRSRAAQLVLVAVQARRHEALAALLAREPAAATPASGPAPAWMAAAAGDDLSLALLLTTAPETALSAAAGPTPATLAAMRGHRRCVQVVAELCPTALCALDGTAGPAACAAARAGHADVLGALADVPGALQARDGEDRTPAYLAAAHGHVSCVLALGQLAPATLSLQVDGITPVEIAFTKGNDDCVRALLALGQPNPSERWRCGCDVGEVCAPTTLGQRLGAP